MKKVASVFSDEELDFIEAYGGVRLTDDTDYSDYELVVIANALADNTPDYIGIFERIIDKFCDHFDVSPFPLEQMDSGTSD